MATLGLLLSAPPSHMPWKKSHTEHRARSSARETHGGSVKSQPPRTPEVRPSSQASHLGWEIATPMNNFKGSLWHSCSHKRPLPEMLLQASLTAQRTLTVASQDLAQLVTEGCFFLQVSLPLGFLLGLLELWRSRNITPRDGRNTTHVCRTTLIALQNNQPGLFPETESGLILSQTPAPSRRVTSVQLAAALWSLRLKSFASPSSTCPLYLEMPRTELGTFCLPRRRSASTPIKA